MDQDVEELLQHLDYKLMAQGWVANVFGWLIWGISLWAVLMAMPAAQEAIGKSNLLSELPRLVASVALAVVAGFLSLLPGGVGAREWILGELLTPRFGPVVAIVSVVLLRLSWLVAEVFISVILYGCGRFGKDQAQADSIPTDTPANHSE